jgi:adenylosuccinate lyase
MRKLFSEVEYRRTWREIWSRLAEVQSKYGLISPEELADILSHKEQVNLERSHEIERQIKHDVMAELKAYVEQCSKGGGKLHLGATSADIIDNADIIRIRKGLEIILQRLLNCLKSTRDNIQRYADLPCIGWTHLQPAEPTTLGYRFANYALDLIMDIDSIEGLAEYYIKGKGIKGAVGTSASFASLTQGKTRPMQMEEEVMKRLGIGAHPVSTQTYPRKVDFLLLSVLASIAQSAHKFGFDVRLLQSPVFGELSEPFGEAQIGSLAMPFKRNPIYSERMCSLARFISSLLEASWINAANALLERTLDDSASRHVIIPESFLATDEMLILYDKIMGNVGVHTSMIQKNLRKFGGFIAVEAILMKLVERGADQQKMHEKIRYYSIDSWNRVLADEENPLPDMLKKDALISDVLKPSEIDELLDVSKYIGDAPERCRMLVDEYINPMLEKHKHLTVGKSDVEF